MKCGFQIVSSANEALFSLVVLSIGLVLILLDIMATPPV